MDKYHKLDKSMSRRIKADLLADGVHEYPVKCNYCDGQGTVDSEIKEDDICPVCSGEKYYLVNV